MEVALNTSVLATEKGTYAQGTDCQLSVPRRRKLTHDALGTFAGRRSVERILRFVERMIPPAGSAWLRLSHEGEISLCTIRRKFGFYAGGKPTEMMAASFLYKATRTKPPVRSVSNLRWHRLSGTTLMKA